MPLIDAYYQITDYQGREAWKQQHPEIIPFVERAFQRKLPPASFATTSRLITDTQLAFEQSDFAHAAKVDFRTRQAAQSLYVTPELKAFWARNDTPTEVRDKYLRGLWHDHLRRLNETFFAIPATDFDAKQKYLEQHPVLWDSWQQNNTSADDLSSVMHNSNAALRDRYFELLDAKDTEGAHAFLHQFPFIFEDTSAADRVDPNTGEWKYGHGGGHGSSPKARAYLAAKSGLDYMFDSLSSWNQRNKWIVGDDPRAVAARNFLATYDGWAWRNGRFAPAAFWSGNHGHGKTQHARDYLAVKSKLDFYFNLLKADHAAAQRWLDGDAKGAKEVRAYFKKWASKGGHTEHAKAYLAAKKSLDVYFALDKQDRKKWLNSHNPHAKIVLAYFKKWGHQSRLAKAWTKNKTWLRTENPELSRRLSFWNTYWSLTPDQRPAYVSQNAAASGVFVYGILGDQERHDAEKKYLREAFLHGIKDKKTALYLRAKPLLDIYFTLTKDDQALFAKANPEVSEYLDAYANHKLTGNKKLDGLIEHYFSLPPNSAARSTFLSQHQDVQHYFNKHSTPAELAMRSLMNTYFSMPGRDRKYFLVQHPELSAYFDQRKQQRHNAQAAASAFDVVDPRLAPWWDRAQKELVDPAQALLREQQLHSREKLHGIERRGDTRQPLDPAEGIKGPKPQRQR
jgi:hypothetical protein